MSTLQCELTRTHRESAERTRALITGFEQQLETCRRNPTRDAAKVELIIKKIRDYRLEMDRYTLAVGDDSNDESGTESDDAELTQHNQHQSDDDENSTEESDTDQRRRGPELHQQVNYSKKRAYVIDKLERQLAAMKTGDADSDVCDSDDDDQEPSAKQARTSGPGDNYDDEDGDHDVNRCLARVTDHVLRAKAPYATLRAIDKLRARYIARLDD